MYHKKTYLERLAEIGKEYEEPLRGQALVRSRLGWEDWAELRRRGVELAQAEIRKRKWRGSRGGVLPGCLGPEDIVDEVVADMFDGKARLAIGWTWERLQRKLERLITQRVGQLRRLKEARALRSEWDVLPSTADGRRVSVMRWIADEAGWGDEATAEREEERARLKERMEELLAGEPELMVVFDCLWEGVKNPVEIGRRLGMGPRAAKNARKRLERRLERLRAEVRARRKPKQASQ